MKRTIRILAVMMFLTSAFAARASVVVFSPPDMSIVTSASIDLQGFIKGGKPGQAVEVRVSGRTLRTLTSPGGLRVGDTLALAPGVNSFTLLDKGDGKETTFSVYFNNGSGKPPEGYYTPVVHAALDDGCDGCHAEEDGAWKTTIEVPGGCNDCHDDFKAGEPASVHPPVDDGDCLSCHGVHTAPNGKLLLNKLPELCWDCHDNVTINKDSAPWKSPHAAVDDGCPTCHAPHSSKAKKLLATKVPELCTDCHDDVAKGEGGESWGAPHDPVDSGDCSACHKAHGSDTGKLLAAPVPVLCNDCHDDVRVDPDGKSWPAPHSPVDDGDCGGCHKVHGSAEKSLLTAKPPALCNECHDDVTKVRSVEEPIVHSPVDDGDCGGCHKVHGAATAKILMKQSPALCAECHDDPSLDDNDQEWAIPHRPVASGACTSCHGAHASGSRGLLLAPFNEICYKCHDAHSHPLQIKAVFKKKVELPKDLKATKKNELPCNYCHLVHGSDDSYMLRQMRQSLCPKCHTL